MAYENVKVKPRQTVTPNTQTKELGITTNVPMGEWNDTTPYKKLNIVRSNGASYQAKKDNQGVEPTVTTGWQEVWQVVAYDGEGFNANGTYPNMSVGDATNAQNDGNGENIAEQFADINEKIPSTASAENQLADKDFVNSSINNMAAFYITSNANGDAFPTRADLLSATTFYSGGQERVPTQNDYAIVLADESKPVGVDGSHPTTRYSYQGGTYPNGQWDFQYVVNNTSLTQAQVDAINSGITKELVEQIGAGGDNYVTCSTESSLVAKVVIKEGFTLNEGAKITVKFLAGNIYNFPTLNVNNTGAKPIIADGDTTYVKWLAGTVMEFVYDGEYWVCTAGYQLAGMRVGFLYTSNNSTSPATLYGGSWTSIKDRFIVGAGNAYAVGSTGGSADAVLINHKHQHTIMALSTEQVTGTSAHFKSGLDSEEGYIYDNGVVGGSVANSALVTDGTDKNMPPYRAEYMWYRTA